MSELLRQGDVLLVRVLQIPPAKALLRRKGRGARILAHGEITGHAHRLEGTGVELWEDEAGTVWLDVREEALLRHEEHAPVKVGRGYYEVRIQREYTPEAIRRVVD